MKKILIPIDGSKHAKKAMEKGKEFAEKFGSKITLLNVKYFSIPYTGYAVTQDVLDAIKSESEDILDENKKYFQKFNINVETVSLHGEVASTIINYIEENDFDLVIMGSHGLNAGAIEGLLLGSIANKVIHKTKKSVLVVK